MTDLFPPDRPALILAPMQDVTDLPFWEVGERFGGGPDIFYTEYFRVHPNSTLEPHILRSVHGAPSGKPVVAQMIGQDVAHLVRGAKDLQKHPIAGIDLNLGCPAPTVCSKDAGGGLLRDLPKIDAILGALRDAVATRFTVKTRLGFYSAEEFDALLAIFAKHRIDLLTVHGRTVKDRYQSRVDYARIRQAREALPCPVVANGNVLSVRLAEVTLRETGADGLMVGRGAIRNPWIFQQLRERAQFGAARTRPSLRDVFAYIEALYEAVKITGRAFRETPHVHKMKKYLNYIGQGVDRDGAFLHQIRRATTEQEFFAICREFLLRDDPLPDEPPVENKMFAGFQEVA